MPIDSRLKTSGMTFMERSKSSVVTKGYNKEINMKQYLIIPTLIKHKIVPLPYLQFVFIYKNVCKATAAKFYLLTALITISLLSGCTLLGPDYQEPNTDADVEKEWLNAEDKSLEVTAPL